MYVKVTAGHTAYGPRGDFLCEVTPPLHYDLIAAELGPDARWSKGENGEDKLDYPDIDWSEALRADVNFLHLLELRADNQTNYEKTKNQLAFRYAWWADPVTGQTAVITTRHIFILGANGKTIDRV